MARVLLWLSLALGLAALPARAQDQPLVVDLSDRLVAITTGFTGSRVLLFGATGGEGDVVVLVRGPAENTVVRRKSRVAGVWVNTDAVTFANVPGFYHIASNRPVAEIVRDSERRRLQIGLDQLRLEPIEPLDEAEQTAFAAALVRNKQRLGLYATVPGEVAYLGNRLFSTPLVLPANVPTGLYTVEVFFVRNGRVVGAVSTPLSISKIGIEARTFRFAHQQAPYYGLIAIVIALVAGWFAGFVFRKA